MSTETKKHLRDLSPKRDFRHMYYFAVDKADDKSRPELVKEFLYKSPDFFDGEQVKIRPLFDHAVGLYYIRTVLSENALGRVFFIWKKQITDKFPSLEIKALWKVIDTGTIGD